MAIREGRWNCTSCESVQLGRNKVCTNCGNARGDDVEIYLPEDAPAVTDRERLDEANAGPDWHCDHCGADNRGDSRQCRQCGAPRGESESRAERFYSLGTEPRSDAAADRIIDEEREVEDAEAIARAGEGISGVAESSYYQSPAEISMRNGLHWFYETARNPIVWGIMAVLLVGFLIWFFTTTRPIPVTVTGLQWQRTIEVERCTTLTQSGWDMPSDGRLRSSDRRIHHYDKVVDLYESRTRTVTETVQTGSRTESYRSGTRSKGNGYFEDVYSTRTVPVYGTRSRQVTESVPIYKDVPVYKMWYVYDVDRWVHERTERAGGNDHEVHWPEVLLNTKERQGQQTEEYTLLLAGDNNRQFTKTLPFERWHQLNVGDHLTAHVTILGVVMRIE